MKKKLLLTAVLSLAVVCCMACGKNQEGETTKDSEEPKQETEATNTDGTEAETEGTDTSLQDIAGPMKTFKSLNMKASDYVDYDEYKGIEVSMAPVEVTDQEVMEYIDYVLANYPAYEEITDRDVIQEGDVANMDYVGKIDGEAFQGGTAQNQNLEIGSNSYIDGFEDGLIGVKVGETVDLNLNFPEDYPSAGLAGKDVVFTVTVNKIQTKKELKFDNEFVNIIGIEGVTDTDGMKSYVNDSILSAKQQEYDAQITQKIWENALAQASFQTPPDELLSLYSDRVYANAQYYAQANGMDMNAFYQANNYTEDSFKAEVDAMSNETAKETLLIYYIAEKENIGATEDEITAMATEYASNYGYSTVDEYLAVVGRDAVEEYLLMDKVQKYLKDNAVVKAEVAEGTDTAEGADTTAAPEDAEPADTTTPEEPETTE